MSTVRIESITVRKGLVSASVRLEPGRESTSSCAGFSERALSILPGLSTHPCTEGGAFAAELADTETAHALEHVALELLQLVGPPRETAGHTAWGSRVYGPGVYRVTLEAADDLTAVGALRLASDIVDWAWTGAGEAPDVPEGCRSLAEKRERLRHLTSSEPPSDGPGR